ncbi:hypothetical protein HMPREF2533_01195 [Bacteroides fragilis]|nr:hypothetical protein HMPREF2530_01195 [Bacteroides fragilis]KXU48401.1 hypothetical protein HMPREF2533_01195 [Bacteroides fragilis]
MKLSICKINPFFTRGGKQTSPIVPLSFTYFRHIAYLPSSK